VRGGSRSPSASKNPAPAFRKESRSDGGSSSPKSAKGDPLAALARESMFPFGCYGASCTCALLPVKMNTALTGRGAPGTAPVTVTFT
jgi:hypothetical protein